jgi:FkbM family methyltransferase
MPNVNFVYVLLFRIYGAVKGLVLDGLLRRSPRARGAFNNAKLLIKRHIFPSRQIWVRVRSGFAQGMWMHLRIPDETGLWSGAHEPEVQKALATLVRPGDVVYDVGAHLGSMTLGMARLVGPTGRVVAFDGDPINVARLRETCLRNDLEHRLQVAHAAVWSRTAANGISFRKGKTETAHGGVEADGQRPVLADGEMIQVPVITLDDFVAAGAPPPQLIKIDVEGGEYEVLRGGAHLFAKQRPLIIAEVHHQQAAEQIHAWLEEFRYAAEWKIPKENFPRCLIARPIEWVPRALPKPESGS